MKGVGLEGRGRAQVRRHERERGGGAALSCRQTSSHHELDMIMIITHLDHLIETSIQFLQATPLD